MRGAVWMLALTVWCAQADAGPQTAPALRRTGIFSNLTYHRESGDLTGMEVMIVPSRDDGATAFKAVVQIAEGGEPCVAVVPVRYLGTALEFLLPGDSPCGEGRFAGRLTQAGLELQDASRGRVLLRRKRSYWQ